MHSQAWRQYCDAFCDDHAFTVDESPHRPDRAQAARPRTPRSRRAVPPRHRRRISPPNLAQPPPTILKPPPTKRCTISATHDVQPFCCPAPSSRSAARQYPPARKMIEVGPCHRPRDRLQPRLVARPVHALHAFAGLPADARLSPAEALTAATINAAHAVSASATEIGSLEARQAGRLPHPRIRRLPRTRLLHRRALAAPRLHRRQRIDAG